MNRTARQLLATLAYLTLAVVTYVAVARAAGSGLDAEDVGAVFALGPPVLIYAAVVGALAVRPRTGAR